MEAGPDAYQAWSSDVAARGFKAITELHQDAANDKGRLKAAVSACNDLDAFVSLVVCIFWTKMSATQRPQSTRLVLFGCTRG